jgi:hypothetical protein
VVAKLDDGRGLEHAILVDDEFSMLQRVDVTFDKEQVRAALHRKEAAPWHIDAVRVLEVLNRGPSGGFQLDNGLAIIGGLWINNNLKLHALIVHDALECW